MDRRLFTFSVVLAVSITLKPIPITAQQGVEQPSESKREEKRKQSNKNQNTRDNKSSQLVSEVTINTSTNETSKPKDNPENYLFELFSRKWTTDILLVLIGGAGVIVETQRFLILNDIDQTKDCWHAEGQPYS
jgi:hypothetical protein